MAGCGWSRWRSWNLFLTRFLPQISLRNLRKLDCYANRCPLRSKTLWMGNLMKVILFGATGMVGQGVVRECLLDTGVESVLAVGRSATGQANPKLREIVHANFLDFSA